MALERRMPSFPIPVNFFQDATMVALDVPAGSWVVDGIVGLSASSSTGDVTASVLCELVGPASYAAHQESIYLPTTITSYTTINLGATLKLDAPATLRVVCRQFGNAGVNTSVTNGFGTRIIATQVGSQTTTEAQQPDQ